MARDSKKKSGPKSSVRAGSKRKERPSGRSKKPMGGALKKIPKSKT